MGRFKTFAFQAERRVHVSNGLWEKIYTVVFILIQRDLVTISKPSWAPPHFYRGIYLYTLIYFSQTLVNLSSALNLD